MRQCSSFLLGCQDNVAGMVKSVCCLVGGKGLLQAQKRPVLCLNRLVRDTIPHMNESSKIHDKVTEMLSRRKDKNDKALRKRKARRREINIGDYVLVKNRRDGSKFMLPFQKDPWMVSAIKGIMVTSKRNQETIKRNISFFKAFRMPDCEVVMENGYQFASSFEADEGDRVDHHDSGFPSLSPVVSATNSQSSAPGVLEMQNLEPVHDSDQEAPDSVPINSLPLRQELE
ncbi:hypothetical protein NDU88_007650 [Pleurodeles waltl]|uniref:Uncharacterized protein n=1 Tax=Pleurodeles waltl TaxID=8319 RepID=A0AAV7QPN0_PLEWA|nr:hypothetical protein NDU88_007650 [Pleurodeles waltl]